MSTLYKALPVTMNRFSWRHGGSYGFFIPNGQLKVSKGGLARLRPNAAEPAWSSSDPLWSARIFVGFNVGPEPVWKMDDVINIVRKVRGAQVGTPDSTFLYQRGLYTHKSSGEVVEEDGAQVIFLNLPDFGVSPKRFQQQALDLGEELAEDLQQEEVIVELQKGGITQQTFGVAGLTEEE